MDTAAIQDTTRLWQDHPEKAKGQPAVRAYSDGVQAVLESGSFSWRCDLPQPLGGTNAAPTPTALLLGALSGCAVAFVKDTLAPMMGVNVEGVEATAQCETDSRGFLGIGGAVPDLQNIRLSITIQSPDPEEQVQRLYQVWRERCPIYLALLKPQPVDTTLHLRRG